MNPNISSSHTPQQSFVRSATRRHHQNSLSPTPYPQQSTMQYPKSNNISHFESRQDNLPANQEQRASTRIASSANKKPADITNQDMNKIIKRLNKPEMLLLNHLQN